jgi:hypothetical protein
MSVAKTDLSIMAEFGEDMKIFVQELAYQTAEALAIDMPVDSGKARSNVVISPTVNYKSLQPFFDYGKNSGEDKSETLNLKFTLNALKSEAANITAFQNVYIMDNAANNGYQYAAKLDGGYSPQTPAGMTDRAIFFGIKKAELKMAGRFEVSIL